MKIAVVAPSAVPFVLGGAERLWNGLVHAINDLTPHDADLLKLPSREHSIPELAASYAAFAQLDLSHFDLVISTKYPAWAASHPNHVVYLQHRLRGLYDMYDRTGLPHYGEYEEPELKALQDIMRSMPDRSALLDVAQRVVTTADRLGADHPAFAFPGPLARELVHAFDRVTLQPGAIRRHAAISQTVAARPGYFPSGVPVRVVHHPSDLQGLHSHSSEYFFTASRLDQPKRIDLIVRAMTHVPADMRLVIAGTGPDEERLRHLAGDDPRIEFVGHVTTAELVEHYARARAVPFVPLDEDLGLITLEAGLARKPVVTCTDSGGTTELVDDGVEGYAVAPNAASIGQAMARLSAHPDLAERMGEAAHARASSVTWERVINALIGHAPSRGNARSRRPKRDKLVVTSTFPVHPRHHGGQLRAFNLYGALTETFDVHIVSLVSSAQPEQRVVLGDGFVETVVSKTITHDQHEFELYRSVGGTPVADISAARFIDLSPRYGEALRGALSDAVGVILAEPFLLPALKKVNSAVPWTYDAYNVESDLKRMILPHTEAANECVALVQQVEHDAVTGAILVSACSASDRDRLIELYGADPQRTTVVPNGVDLSRTKFTPVDRRQELAVAWLRSASFPGAEPRPRHLAVFVGSGHPPNIEAVKRLADVAAVTPDVLFVVAGSVCQPLETWVFPENLLPLGAVSDHVKDVLLASAHVALNPVEQGSGTNLKLVEYFAAGAPVVATPIGARGVGVRAGEHLAVAGLDSPQAFGALVRRVAAGGSEVRAMVAAARALADHHGWDNVGARYREMLVDAFENRLSWTARPRQDALHVSRPPTLWAASP